MAERPPWPTTGALVLGLGAWYVNIKKRAAANR
jgi:hypothetical protein